MFCDVRICPQAAVMNLTERLNMTESLSADRLRDVTDELVLLEGVAELTQQQVDMLTAQVSKKNNNKYL